MFTAPYILCYLNIYKLEKMYNKLLADCFRSGIGKLGKEDFNFYMLFYLLKIILTLGKMGLQNIS